MRESTRKRFNSRRLNGLCIRCGEEAVTLTLCEKHRQREQKKSALFRQKYKAEGRCVRCGAPKHEEFNHLSTCIECNELGIFSRHQREGRY